jgi:transcriptional regulator with XRE-family HTH domain
MGHVNLGSNIIRAREKRGVSQAELARRLGRYRSGVNYLEHGLLVVTPAMLVVAGQVAEALDCPYEEIVDDRVIADLGMPKWLRVEHVRTRRPRKAA